MSTSVLLDEELSIPAGVDSLSAFFPGVQVLMGDVEAAIKGHAVYAWQWRRYRALPELFDISRRQAVANGYPLRPEFIESNMYLYHVSRSLDCCAPLC